jgi:hypothetical protein
VVSGHDLTERIAADVEPLCDRLLESLEGVLLGDDEERLLRALLQAAVNGARLAAAEIVAQASELGHNFALSHNLDLEIVREPEDG